MTASEKESLYELLKQYKLLSHPSMLKLICFWRNEIKNEFVIITEPVLCSLRSFLSRKTEDLTVDVIRNWVRCILQGLEHMHSQSPPLIHTDLNCENLFLKLNSAEIRIINFGPPSFPPEFSQKKQEKFSNFIPVEISRQFYEKAQDLYALGLCIIEMCTKKPLYSESNGPISLANILQTGKKTGKIDFCADKQIMAFLGKCFGSEGCFPTAHDLQADRFFADIPLQTLAESPVSVYNFKMPGREIIEIDTEQTPDGVYNLTLIVKKINDLRFKIEFSFDPIEDVPEKVAEELAEEIGLSPEGTAQVLTALKSTVDYECLSSDSDEAESSIHPSEFKNHCVTLNLKLRLEDVGKTRKLAVDFVFDPEFDSAEGIASELIRELNISEDAYPAVVEAIRNRIATALTLNNFEENKHESELEASPTHAASTRPSIGCDQKSLSSSKQSTMGGYENFYSASGDSPLSEILSPFNGEFDEGGWDEGREVEKVSGNEFEFCYNSEEVKRKEGENEVEVEWTRENIGKEEGKSDYVLKTNQCQCDLCRYKSDL
jgi:serine/threonine protein kinase